MTKLEKVAIHEDHKVIQNVSLSSIDHVKTLQYINKGENEFNNIIFIE